MRDFWEWYASKSNCICTRFCITDDLEKSNEMITSASSMTVKMLLPFQLSLLMRIYFWALTMLQIKQKITTTLLGWLIMLRKTMGFRPSSKILQLNSTEKVLVRLNTHISLDGKFVCLQNLLHHFRKEFGMQKAVEARLVQKVQLCTVLKLTLLLTSTTT